MNEKKIDIKQMNDHVYLMDEAHEATGYVVVGEERACVIDTMIGYNDIYETVRSITDKPLIVVNTHGHPDHIYGNVYFNGRPGIDAALMNLRDLPIAELHMQNEEFLAECAKRNVSMPPFKDIHEGDTIELGGLTLEIYDLPGHTPGGILLLLVEDRILFTGDSINHHLWMQLEESLSLSEFLPELERVFFLEQRADRILHGHARDFDDISLMRATADGIREIIAGSYESDPIYEWWGGKDLYHIFQKPADRHFQQQEESCICYRRGAI